MTRLLRSLENRQKWSSGSWNAHAAKGKDVDDIKQRIAEVPEQYREGATLHARTVWRLKNK